MSNSTRTGKKRTATRKGGSGSIYGILGKFWGDKSNLPHNIAALSIIFLLVAGIAYTFICLNHRHGEQFMPVRDMWNILTPLITLAFGCLFAEAKAKA